jgi:sugar phosphate isomerase/epimerase
MVVGLSTAHLLSPRGTVDAVVRAIADAAPAAVELAAGGPEPFQLELLQALARQRSVLPLQALEAYAPAARASAGPALCALDRAERTAAVKCTERSLHLAAEVGIGVLVVSLGRVEVDADWPLVRTRFARDEVAPELWRCRRAERDARAPLHLDAARDALEPLLRLAERCAVTLGLINRPGYDEVPDAAEVGALLAEFGGARLGTYFDTAAACVQETLGTAAPGAHLAAFGAHALGAHLTDAAGFARGLPPGVGEVDFAALRGRLPETAPLFVRCAPASYPREVREALARMRALLG